jgi:hypothetical protein
MSRKYDYSVDELPRPIADLLRRTMATLRTERRAIVDAQAGAVVTADLDEGVIIAPFKGSKQAPLCFTPEEATHLGICVGCAGQAIQRVQAEENN